MKLWLILLPYLATATILLFGESRALPQSTVVFPDQLKEKHDKLVAIKNMYLEALKKCLDHGDKMPIFDDDKGQYVCQTLLEQGPCAKDEWFVAIPDLPVPIAKCQPRPCDGLDSLVPIEGEKACKLLYGSSDCAPGMELLANPFGKGMWRCCYHIVGT